MDKETFFQEYKGIVIAGTVVFVVGLILLLNFIFSTKQLALKNSKQTSIKAGDNYTVEWSSSNIKRVGIVLFYGDKPQWIVPNYPAGAGKYVWNSPTSLDAGSDYRIAVFEYPWRNGNKIVYASATTEIIGQKYASCEDFSVAQEWPHLADNYLNAHKVFITNGTWPGNLGGIVGADAKCKQEAAKNGYSGDYVAFLGTDKVAAVERITKSGVLIEAEPSGSLPNGRTCHRLLAAGIQKFLDKTRLSKVLIDVEFSENFARRLGDVWYGRRTASADTKCLEIDARGTNSAFSGTYTCQNWETDKHQVYSGAIPDEADLPKCYDSEGKNVFANYFGAVAGGKDSAGLYIVSSDTCNTAHRLICIEQ
jgi:hypothetical protein